MEPDGGSCEDDDQPTLIEYARFYGLALDHLATDPLRSESFSSLILGASEDLQDSPELVNLEDLASPITEEKLEFSKNALPFLSAILRPSQELGYDELEHPQFRRAVLHKMELPMLKSDHELDMRDFAPLVIPDLEGLNIPFEEITEDEDFGETLQQSAVAESAYTREKAEAERLEVSKALMMYLQDIIKSPAVDEDDMIEAKRTSLDRKVNFEPATPPLLPLSPSPTPFIPTSTTGRLELLSDEASLTAEEGMRIEKALMEADTILLPKTGKDSEQSYWTSLQRRRGETSHALPRFQEVLSSSPPSVRITSYQRMVEGPLTPPRGKNSPNQINMLEFPDDLLDAISGIPLHLDEFTDDAQAHDSSDSFLQDILVPIATKVEKIAEQEQLQEADATKRVQVPVMDFSLPAPPWSIESSAAVRTKAHGMTRADAESRRLMIQMRAEHLQDTVCHGVSRVERELCWMPFPLAFGTDISQEHIQDDGSVKQYLEDDNSPVDSSALIPEAERLSLLDDVSTDNNSDLEPAILSERLEARPPPKKRKRDDENAPSDKVAGSRQSEKSALTGFPSTATSLDKYLQLRGIDVAKRHKLLGQSETRIDQPDETQLPTSRLASEPQSSTAKKAKLFPRPQLGSIDIQRQFIISSASLLNRGLIRRIQHLYPRAEFIERESSLESEKPQRQDQLHSSPQHEHRKVADHEVDLILSPSTGLIWTTLQKIKQQSLPGNNSRSRTKDRIANVSNRYERLIVLVSENRLILPEELDSSALEGTAGDHVGRQDCQAIAELTAFTAAINSEIVISYVGGKDDEMAVWVVQSMAKYGVQKENIRLLQEETLVRPTTPLITAGSLTIAKWERLLRHAGMDAYAAQAILAELKAPDGISEDDAQNYGLTAFVMMSTQDRLKRFEMLLGGSRVLTRVSQAIDASWR